MLNALSRFRARFDLCELERRDAPANLKMNTALLVDAANAAQANPVYGQMIYVRAEWQHTQFSGSEPAVPIRYTVNYPTNYFTAGSPPTAYPANGGTITHTGANGSWSWYRGGWYAGVSAFTVTATIDPDNQIAEDDETDNSFTINVSPVAPTTLPNKFLQPIGKTPNKDWSITNYADIDPRGSRADHRLGGRQYDGHDAIDAGPNGGFADQDAGLPITAVADGVIDVVDGGDFFDRETSTNGGQFWNAVYVNHGNGWRTQYGHLAAGSTTVKVGDAVKAGQILGLMGSSGFSTGTHVHYTAFYRGCQVEAGFSPASYWASPLPYADAAPGHYYNSGITNYNPFANSGEFGEKPAQYTSIGTADVGSDLLYFYVGGYNLKATDVMYWRWVKPDGTFETSNFSPDQNYNYSTWWWTRNVSSFQGAVGTWQIKWYLNGLTEDKLQRSQSFEVVAGQGAGSIRMTAAGGAHVIDGRTTAIPFAAASLGGTAPELSFTVFNHGRGPLVLQNFALPAGMSLVTSATPPGIAAGGQATVTIRLDTAVAGAKFGGVRFDTNDPDVGTFEFNVSGTVTGSAPAGSPVINLSASPATTYNYLSLPRLLTPLATLTDADSANFAGGNLRVEFASFGAPNDQLGIRSQGLGAGQIGVAGTTLYYSGTVIGTIVPGAALVVNFNASSTVAAGQALLRNLTYRNSSATPTTQRKAVRYTLTDNAGKVSNLAVQHVVNSGYARNPTVAGGGPLSVVRGGTLLHTANFTDPFGTAWTAVADYGDGTGLSPVTVNADKSLTLVHQYTAAPGSYTITLTVMSAEGGTHSVTIPMTVLPNAAVTSVAVPPAGAYGLGEVMDFTVTFADPVTVTTGGGTPSLPVTLNTGGTVQAAYVSGSGTTNLLFRYAVQPGQVDPDGITVGASLQLNGGTMKGAGGLDATLTLNGVPSTANVLVGDPPTGVSVSPSAVAENLAAGAAVGAFSSVDVNGSDTFTYQLVSGTGDADNGSFTVLGTTLRTAAVFDYEARTSYTVRVRSTDSGGLTYEQALTVGVNNVNEAPTNLTLSNAAVAENLAAGAAVGAVTTADPDAGDSFSYAFAAGAGDADNAKFSITAGGALTTAAAFDFETKSSYAIRVVSTDAGGLPAEKAFTITVQNRNDAPTDLALSNAAVGENLAAGAAVGTVTTADADAGDTFLYAFAVGGADNASFALTAGGVLTTAAAFDFETKSSYAIRVKSTDAGGLTAEKAFTVTVQNRNDAPTGLSLSAAAVGENLSGAAVGTVTTQDADAGETFEYSFAAGAGADDNARFAISAGGVLTTAEAFNFEVKNTYTVRVKSADAGGAAAEAAFTITVNDVNEAPTITGAPYARVYHAGLPANSVIATVTAADPDAGDAAEFFIVGGDPAGVFAIGADTGVITLPDAALAAGDYALTVRVVDGGGLSADAVVTIDRNTTPTVPTPVPDAVRLEDAAAFTVNLADYFTDAETPAGGLVYAVESNSAAAVVTAAVAGTTLTLTPQLNRGGTATVVVRATDAAGLSVTDTFDVTVTPVNDRPTLADIPNPTAIGEDAVEQTVTLAGVTPGGPADEAGQVLTVSASSSDPALIPAVTATQTGGVWRLTYAPAANAHGTAVITVTVADDGGTADAGEDTIQKTFSVTVNPVNDAPVIDTVPSVIVEIVPAKAKTVLGAPVAALAANVTDADQGAARGIAVTAAVSTEKTGQWQYSVNGGAAWANIGAVRPDAALLLAAGPANRVRFVPAAKFAGFASIEYKAWDTTTGAAGGTGDTGVGTAFIAAPEKATVAVGKTTPAIDMEGNPQFTSIPADTASPRGDAVKAMLGMLVSDVDPKTAFGMAVVSADASNGAWQYRVGGKWVDVTGVSPASALLLGPTTPVRFVPARGYFGTATLGYHAWDQSFGKAGDRAAVAGTAFSSLKETAEVNVVAKPALDISAPRTLGVKALVGDLLAGAVTQVPAGAVMGIAVTKLTGSGTWMYKVGTAAAVPLKASAASAVLLPADAFLQFAPAAGYTGAATLAYRAWNATAFPAAVGARANPAGMAFSAATETLVKPAAGGNAAPLIGALSVDLGTLAEDAKTNAGFTVKSLVAKAQIADADAGDKPGVVLTAAASGGGEWQYSLDGKLWSAVGAVTPTAALALPATAKLKFVPVQDFSGPAAIGFKAWDGSAGSGGDILNAAAGSAFSAGPPAAAVLTVTPANDSPALDNSAVRFLPLIAAGGTSAAVPVSELTAGASDQETHFADIGIYVTAATGPGDWKVSTDGTTFSDLPALPALLASSAALRFEGAGGAGLATLTYQAWDTSSGTTTKLKPDALSVAKETLTVAVGNAPPTLSGPGMLTTITEDPKTNKGDTVAALLGATFDAGGVGGKGIAVVGASAPTAGAWQYSLNAGKTWADLTGVSATAALLLPDAAKVRFVPAKDAASTAGAEPALTYTAWDQTVGSAGEFADTTAAGVNAFSAAQTAAVTVTAVPDAPTLDASRTPVMAVFGPAAVGTFLAGAVSSPDATVFGIAVTGLTGKGTWLANTGAGFVEIGKVSAGAARLLPATAVLKFQPLPGAVGTATLTYKAWDVANSGLAGVASTTGPATKAFFSSAAETLSVSVGNRPPTLTTL